MGEFLKEIKVEANEFEVARRQREAKAVEDALLDKKNGNEDSIAHIIISKSRDTVSIYGTLDSERLELLEKIGKEVQQGNISDEHFKYFSSYDNLTKFMDKYLERLNRIINSEPSGEIIIEPEIDSEMENIMKEIEEEKEYVK